MSIYKLKNLLCAYTAIDDITRNSNLDSNAEVLNYRSIEQQLVALLVDEGLPYDVKGGKVIIDINGYTKSYNINDIYPYISPDGQYKIMFKNMQDSMPQSEYLLQQKEEYNDDSKRFGRDTYNTQVKPAKEEEISDLSNSDYIETYIPSMQQEEKREENEFRAINDVMPEKEEKEEELTDDLIKEALMPDKTEEKSSSDEISLPEFADAVEQITGNSAPVSETETSVLREGEPQNAMPPEVKAINKNEMTYEKATLVLRDKRTGALSKLLAVSFPLDKDDRTMITHIATRDSSTTLLGEVTETPFNDTTIITRRSRDNSFSCDYYVRDNNYYEIRKEGVKQGGNSGHLSIYDEDLAVYAYPIGTKNNENGEATLAYYIYTEGYYYCSSTKENPAVFNYRGKKYMLRAVWNGDMAYINIAEAH
jgi:hypothetical protein